ncbi:hypothetical protein VTK73DRAFT_1610 [Phialemonium thermophilum]|uniref:Uncharacterized protein n=1 Tax=Phialemonium thermophilum TaxID=223376 RepID=A0ABR3Y328_9PEZI
MGQGSPVRRVGRGSGITVTYGWEPKKIGSPVVTTRERIPDPTGSLGDGETKRQVWVEDKGISESSQPRPSEASEPQIRPNLPIDKLAIAPVRGKYHPSTYLQPTGNYGRLTAIGRIESSLIGAPFCSPTFVEPLRCEIQGKLPLILVMATLVQASRGLKIRRESHLQLYPFVPVS